VAVQSLETSLRNGVVERLQEMAADRRSLQSMVDFVKTEIGPSEVYVVPMMSYFCRAFSLPLRDILPLREWVDSHDNSSVSTLLSRIESFALEQRSAAKE